MKKYYVETVSIFNDDELADKVTEIESRSNNTKTYKVDHVIFIGNNSDVSVYQIIYSIE